MNWKRFKNLSRDEKVNEARFILGIDLGNATSAIAYFDAHHSAPEIIDLSGGYGKPTAPTVMQYIPETGEWVFGEYAMLNRGGREITVKSLVERLGQKSFIDVDNKAVGIPGILALYIKELIGNCRNLNPRAEIGGIVVAVPDFLSENALSELTLAFKIAGYEKEIIGFVSDRECILHKHFYKREAKREAVLVLDFGSRELRGGVYQLEPEAGALNAKSISFLNSRELGVGHIDDDVTELFKSFYLNEFSGQKLMSQTEDTLESFSYQHKDLLFQKNIQTKPIKLYFNFSYPPFQKTVSKAMIDELILPYERKFEGFIKSLLQKNLTGEGAPIKREDIRCVLATGGGFEMLWARNILNRLLPEAEHHIYKNAKCAAAEGASIIAATRLGVTESKNITIEDKLRLRYDFGFIIERDRQEKFYPMVEKNVFWWQNAFSGDFVINEKIEDYSALDFYARDENGDLNKLYTFALEGMPRRPKGATRVNIVLEFISVNKIRAVISDMGFGALFPSSGFRQEITIPV